MAADRKRFTVSLDQAEYRRLKQLANDHRPKLSLRYLVEYAVHDLLNKAEEDPQFRLALGDPIEHD